jgi:hypothetical protein
MGSVSSGGGPTASRALVIFRGLCEDLALADLVALKVAVRAHYHELIDAQRRNEFIALDLADALCVRLESLLAMAHLLDPGPRGQVVGAARYYISSTDEQPDAESCTGLDDDVEVFNHVVRLLGRLDLVIAD